MAFQLIVTEPARSNAGVNRIAETTASSRANLRMEMAIGWTDTHGAGAREVPLGNETGGPRKVRFLRGSGRGAAEADREGRQGITIW